jgi:hypothetical protein
MKLEISGLSDRVQEDLKSVPLHEEGLIEAGLSVEDIDILDLSINPKCLVPPAGPDESGPKAILLFAPGLPKAYLLRFGKCRFNGFPVSGSKLSQRRTAQLRAFAAVAATREGNRGGKHGGGHKGASLAKARPQAIFPVAPAIG